MRPKKVKKVEIQCVCGGHREFTEKTLQKLISFRCNKCYQIILLDGVFETLIRLFNPDRETEEYRKARMAECVEGWNKLDRFIDPFGLV